MMTEILAIKPSKQGKSDSLIWLPTANGEYSTKTGYYTYIARKDAHLDQHVHSYLCDWNKDIWRGQFSPKVLVFLWKIVKGALPLGENLEKRGFGTNVKCIHCGSRETASHIFLHCRFAKSMRELAPVTPPEIISSALSFEAGLKASTKLTNLPPSGLANGPLFPWICWTIWTTRNQQIFENRVITVEETLSKAICLAKE